MTDYAGFDREALNKQLHFHSFPGKPLLPSAPLTFVAKAKNLKCLLLICKRKTLMK